MIFQSFLYVYQLCGQAGIMVNRVSPAILGEQGPSEKPLFWADFLLVFVMDWVR